MERQTVSLMPFSLVGTMRKNGQERIRLIQKDSLLRNGSKLVRLIRKTLVGVNTSREVVRVTVCEWPRGQVQLVLSSFTRHSKEFLQAQLESWATEINRHEDCADGPDCFRCNIEKALTHNVLEEFKNQ